MKLLIEKGDEFLRNFIKRQLNNIFYWEESDELSLNAVWNEALERTYFSFSYCQNKYYRRDGEVYFNPLQGAQYTIFLYYLSSSLADKQFISLADRVYYLNKTLNNVDLYHQVKLPKIFFLDHPLASVIGRATYSDYFTFRQNCTVGNNNGKYPTLGENVRMMANSSILGDCKIEQNVIIASGTQIKDENIPANSLVFGASPNLIIKTRPAEYFEKFKGFP